MYLRAFIFSCDHLSKFVEKKAMKLDIIQYFHCHFLHVPCLYIKVSCSFKIIYRTTILPVVLYGCETWSLTLREERKLRMFEDMVLRRIFGLRRDEVTVEWRRMHNEELNDLYSSPNMVWVI